MDEERKLELSASRQEQIIEVVKQMMYVFGDFETPTEICVQFVTNMVKFHCVKFLEDAYQYCKPILANAGNRKRKNEMAPLDITCVVFIFRRHSLLLSRLYKFAKVVPQVIHLPTPILQAAAAIRSLSRDTEDAKWGRNNNEESELENEIDSDEEGSGASKFSNGVDDKIGVAIESLQNPELCLSRLEKMIDRVTALRDQRQFDRVQRMNAAEYEMFSDARKATFRMSTAKMSQPKFLSKLHVNDILLSWLGSPPVGLHVDFVVAFVARETLACLVESALIVREQEAPNTFNDDPNSLPGALQLRHYEEALRLNMGYRRNKDLLFGYF